MRCATVPSFLSLVMTMHTVVLTWKSIIHFSQVIINDLFILQYGPEDPHVSIATPQYFRGLL